MKKVSSPVVISLSKANSWLKLQKRDNSELEARILLKTPSFCKTILTLNHNTPSTHPL